MRFNLLARSKNEGQIKKTLWHQMNIMDRNSTSNLLRKPEAASVDLILDAFYSHPTCTGGHR